MTLSFVLTWLYWHFIGAPLNILKGTLNFIVFILNFFSIPILLKTLFSPWRRYAWQKPKGFNISLAFQTASFNFISRIIGALIRIFVIIIGILFIVLTIVAGLSLLFLWIISPFLIIKGIIYAFSIIF